MEDRLVAGHGMCLGCGIPLSFKVILRATKTRSSWPTPPAAWKSAPPSSPRTAWTACGCTALSRTPRPRPPGRTMFKALKEQRSRFRPTEDQVPRHGRRRGTYDIGIQSLFRRHGARPTRSFMSVMTNNAYAQYRRTTLFGDTRSARPRHFAGRRQEPG